MNDYVKLKRTRQAFEMLVTEPNTFLILTYIALTARKIMFRGVERLHSDIEWNSIPYKKYKGGLTRAKFRSAIERLRKARCITIAKNKKREIFLLENDIFIVDEDASKHNNI